MLTQKEMFNLINDVYEKTNSVYFSPKIFTLRNGLLGTHGKNADFLANKFEKNGFFDYYHNKQTNHRKFDEKKYIKGFDYYSLASKLEIIKSRNLYQYKLFQEDLINLFTHIKLAIETKNNQFYLNTINSYQTISSLEKKLHEKREILKELENTTFRKILYSIFSDKKQSIINEINDIRTLLHKEHSIYNQNNNFLNDNKLIIENNHFISFLSNDEYQNILDKNYHRYDNSSDFFKNSVFRTDVGLENQEKSKLIKDTLFQYFKIADTEKNNESFFNSIKSLNYFLLYDLPKTNWAITFNKEDKIIKYFKLYDENIPFIIMDKNEQKYLVANPLFFNKYKNDSSVMFEVFIDIFYKNMLITPLQKYSQEHSRSEYFNIFFGGQENFNTEKLSFNNIYYINDEFHKDNILEILNSFFRIYSESVEAQSFPFLTQKDSFESVQNYKTELSAIIDRKYREFNLYSQMNMVDKNIERQRKKL